MVRFEACKGPREGGRIATASHDSTVRIWCAASGALLAALTGHTDKVTTISWSADGGELISADQVQIKPLDIEESAITTERFDQLARQGLLRRNGRTRQCH